MEISCNLGLFVRCCLLIANWKKQERGTEMATKIDIKQVLAMGPNCILWDSAVKGFNARRQKSEAVTFTVFYRTLDRQQRWHRIGRYGVWSVQEARREAQRVLRARDLGEDPSGARMALRASPTMAELLDQYVADLDAHRISKKANTIYTDKNRIKKHIAPRLGKLKVASVTQAQIEDWMSELCPKLSPGSANRIIGLTGAVFTYAVKKKLRTDNPVRGIEMPKENKRTRRLSIAEYAQLVVRVKRLRPSTLRQAIEMTHAVTDSSV
jgi:Phage integrase, N-terminal SAM-like domain/Arm DNA-binding domain